MFDWFSLEEIKIDQHRKIHEKYWKIDTNSAKTKTKIKTKIKQFNDWNSDEWQIKWHFVVTFFFFKFITLMWVIIWIIEKINVSNNFVLRLIRINNNFGVVCTKMKVPEFNRIKSSWSRKRIIYWLKIERKSDSNQNQQVDHRFEEMVKKVLRFCYVFFLLFWNNCMCVSVRSFLLFFSSVWKHHLRRFLENLIEIERKLTKGNNKRYPHNGSWTDKIINLRKEALFRICTEKKSITKKTIEREKENL